MVVALMEFICVVRNITMNFTTMENGFEREQIIQVAFRVVFQTAKKFILMLPLNRWQPLCKTSKRLINTEMKQLFQGKDAMTHAYYPEQFQLLRQWPRWLWPISCSAHEALKCDQKDQCRPAVMWRSPR